MEPDIHKGARHPTAMSCLPCSSNRSRSNKLPVSSKRVGHASKMTEFSHCPAPAADEDPQSVPWKLRKQPTVAQVKIGEQQHGYLALLQEAQTPQCTSLSQASQFKWNEIADHIP